MHSLYLFSISHLHLRCILSFILFRGGCWVRRALATYPFWEWSVTISYCPVFLLLFLLFPTIYGGPIDLPSSKCVLSEGKTSWMQI